MEKYSKKTAGQFTWRDFQAVKREEARCGEVCKR